MFGRIFGRGKDDRDQAVCAECGRTLLAGEWTQTVVDDRGNERLICSLCGQAYAGAGEPVAQAPTPANAGRMRETRSEARSGDPAPSPEPAVAPDAVAPEPAAHARGESDALWLALKDKDAQIEALKARLAQAEAERQELAGRLAHLETSDAAEAEPGSVTMDSSEPGERTWGETPAEFAAELAALPQSGPATTEPGTSWPGPGPSRPSPAPRGAPAGPLRQQGAAFDQQQARADTDEVDQALQLIALHQPYLSQVLSRHLDQRNGGDIQLLTLDQMQQQIKRAIEDGQFDLIMVHRGRMMQ